MSPAHGNTPAVAKPAATVIVTRMIADASGIEVFMVKRHGRSAFMPAFHVFPGGKVEEADYEIARRLDTATKERALEMLDGINDAEEAASFVIAAIRETAEECGLLLARDAAGDLPGHTVAEEVFNSLQQGVSFSQLLDTLGLALDFSMLQPYSWWITPKSEPRRYDTRFFWAEAPPAQVATSDNLETTEGVWLSPADILRCHADRELSLAPPTIITLHDLCERQHPADVMKGIHCPIQPVCPHFTQGEEGTPLLVLPGDPLYPTPSIPVSRHRTRFRVLENRRFE